MPLSDEQRSEVARMRRAGRLAPGEAGKLEAWRRFGSPEAVDADAIALALGEGASGPGRGRLAGLKGLDELRRRYPDIGGPSSAAAFWAEFEQTHAPAPSPAPGRPSKGTYSYDLGRDDFPHVEHADPAFAARVERALLSHGVHEDFLQRAARVIDATPSHDQTLINSAAEQLREEMPFLFQQ